MSTELIKYKTMNISDIYPKIIFIVHQNVRPFFFEVP